MHIQESPQRIRCTQQDLPRLAEIAAAAFLDYPETRFYFPQAPTRERDARWLCETLLKVALRKGEVYADPQFRSCMAFLPPGVAPASNWEYALAGYWQFLFRYGAAATRKISDYNARMDAKQHELMAGRRYYHLWLLAVHPQHQASGLGGHLLKALCAASDAEAKPVYLVTHTQANTRYYERFGFEDLGLVEGPDQPPFWPMKREPLPADTAAL